MTVNNDTDRQAVIELSDLTKYYGKIRGIEDVNLRVPEGSVYGFIGPNGAGKSTTIRLLLGLIRPDAGRIKLFGQVVSGQPVGLLTEVGYMPGEAIFYQKMKVGDLIRYSAALRGRQKESASEAKALCERFNLDTGRRIQDLSLGNRKKVSIVCALQHKPRLLLLDEPTSGLDPLVQQTFWEVLRERQKEGATVFLSSHVLTEVQHHCREAAIIRDGRIVSAGNVKDLLSAAARRISLSGLDAPSMETLMQRLESDDVTDIGEALPGRISFLFRGDLPAFVKGLSSLEYQDLTIAEPDLEEIFLHYYGKENEQ